MAPAQACDARPYSIEELFAIHDMSTVSVEHIELSEECPRGKQVLFIASFGRVYALKSPLSCLFPTPTGELGSGALTIDLPMENAIFSRSSSGFELSLETATYFLRIQSDQVKQWLLVHSI